MSEPSFFQKLQHLGQDLAAAAEDGAKPVSDEQYWARIATCDKCEHRQEGNCGLCDCVLVIKSAIRSWTCPDHRWPALAEEEESS